MNWADWVIIAIMVVSSLISLKRGFVKEALSMANWVLAFIVAMTFGDQLSALLVDQITTPSVRDMAAFAILFAATLIVGAMVNYLIGELVRMTGLSGTDRLFGMMFGMVRGFIVVMAILLLIPAIIPIDKDAWWNDSLLIPHLMEFESWCRTAAREFTSFVGRMLNG
ncbi:CvpA family protein [Teredinibacter haidensis]|uniref:CvpA family protein n=1 Tax=Teredinibacter haidensis TaxID=2731755 RepID=UPI0009490D5D|nr:CvpA family protein [Teredinibacter haidensis]